MKIDSINLWYHNNNTIHKYGLHLPTNRNKYIILSDTAVTLFVHSCNYISAIIYSNFPSSNCSLFTFRKHLDLIAIVISYILVTFNETHLIFLKK